VSETADRSPARVAAAVVLGIVAILLIIASILYFTEPAHSLPSFLGAIKSPVHRADEKRSLRGVITLVVAIVCFVAAGFAFMWKGKDRN
jgi:hypothetical protein